ncbi:UCH-domain-containing protein [Wallemia mellicola]|uniref:ubiquitinyl hydrolase 1 n=1 Tax=Wallemia mellicola TaxID=1708541 RepID=A0A4T0S759_9BASI|nr:UCH-domain-containing protein [Wallemia mellicola]TIC08137.1 UCH-domain-containing protein [Wallemia mellicola]TIC47285.1 UCH-domain-containing protein [Wallemia mellicola]
MLSNKRSFRELEGNQDNLTPNKRNPSEEREALGDIEFDNRPSTPSIHNNVEDLSISEDIQKCLDIIKKGLSEPLVYGQTWYIIPKDWIINLESKASENESIQVDKINTYSLTNGKDLLPNLSIGDQIEIIPEDVNIKFGYQGPQIKRIVVKTSDIPNTERVELYPPTFRLLALTSQKPTTSPVSEQETTFDLSIDAPLSMLLGMSIATLYPDSLVDSSNVSQRARLWRIPDTTNSPLKIDTLYYLPNTQRDLIDTSNGSLKIYEAMLEDGGTFCLEVLDKFGNWPYNDYEQSVLDQPFGKSGFLDRLESKQSSNTKMMTRSQSSQKVKTKGLVGLQNLGNTCFMNSALQCLSNTSELSVYFLSGLYSKELNPDNPLGMSGQVAESFGQLVNKLWYGSSNSVAPREFKYTLSKFAPSFAGYGQQDTQEFLAFLLDGLHEDLNRIKSKPYTEIPDWEGGTDADVAKLAKTCWDLYKQRNDSIIVDLFQGQFKSTVNCPECDRVSITFDPFMYLTLPLPIQSKWNGSVYYIPYDYNKKRLRIDLELPSNASFKLMKNKISQIVDTNSNNLWVAEEYKGNLFKSFLDDELVSEMQSGDLCFVYELPIHIPQDRHEKIDRVFETNWVMFPVYSSTFKESSSLSGEVFGKPMLIALRRSDAQNYQKVYQAIIEKYLHFTKNDEALKKINIHSKDITLRHLEAPSNSYYSYRTSDVNTGRSNNIERNSKTDLKFRASIVENILKSTLLKKNEKNPVEHIEDVNKIDDQGDLEMKQDNSLQDQSIESLYENLETERQKSLSLIKFGEALVVEWKNDLAEEVFGDDLSSTGLWEQFDVIEDPQYVQSKQTSKSPKKGITIEDCLDEFTKEEKLGEEDLWYCSKCQKHQQATKKFDLWKVPDVLVVHLKRFASSRYNRDKLDQFVDFPIEELNIDDRVGEKQVANSIKLNGGNPVEVGIENSEEDAIYDLYAIDNHYGGLGGGHYTSYARNNESGEFYHFDDSYVSKVNEENVKTKAAYLLFYRKRTTRSIGGKARIDAEEQLKIDDATSSTMTADQVVSENESL